jgi:rhodanese-related sulfurtransferase
MGNSISIKKINFEDMQNAINDMNTLIINTLNVELQKCLIERTTTIDQESRIINTILKLNKETTIVVYGMNATDETIVNKYNQLINLGFTNVYIYPGGLFEWLLLQDIYGDDIFKTTSKELDILKYKGVRVMGNQLMLR